jgi:uncharacterized protein (TIGR04255 family)
MVKEKEYPKLERQPLSLVLAEFRFSPVLKIADFIPDFQERFRKTFPATRDMKRQSIQVDNQGVHVGSIRAWMFTTPEGDKAIEIDQERLVYFSSSYGRFPGFLDECVEALTILKELIDPGLLLRVGLRYNDIVIPGEDEDLTAYLNPSLMPPSPLLNMGADVNQHRTETLFQTDVGILAIRIFVSQLGLTVMPDLSGRLPVDVRKDAPSGRLSAVLDFDHYWVASERGVIFTPEVAKEHLKKLHRIAREAFWKLTTKFARSERWS